jgi:hypothetical protein
VGFGVALWYVESVCWTFPVLFSLSTLIIHHTMFAYVSNIWCYSAPCGSCFWQTSQISPYPWQLILRVQTVGTVFKWICVMLSHTSLIVSSTFMACIYKHTHTHTHREMTFPLTISTSLEDWSQGKAARNGFWLKLRGNFYRILFLLSLSFELPFLLL